MLIVETLSNKSFWVIFSLLSSIISCYCCYYSYKGSICYWCGSGYSNYDSIYGIYNSGSFVIFLYLSSITILFVFESNILSNNVTLSYFSFLMYSENFFLVSKGLSMQYCHRNNKSSYNWVLVSFLETLILLVSFYTVFTLFFIWS